MYYQRHKSVVMHIVFAALCMVIFMHTPVSAANGDGNVVEQADIDSLNAVLLVSVGFQAGMYEVWAGNYRGEVRIR